MTDGKKAILSTFIVPDIFNAKTLQVTLPFPDVSDPNPGLVGCRGCQKVGQSSESGNFLKRLEAFADWSRNLREVKNENLRTHVLDPSCTISLKGFISSLIEIARMSGDKQTYRAPNVTKLACF